MKQEYYPNLDWIRLFLATEVVFIHAGIAHKILVSPVPAFLAVSGFVVYGSIQRWSISQFFINRVLRVLPLLFASFVAVGALFGYEAMVKNIVFWLWPFGEPPVNPVVWSLMYEEVYYALLAVLCAAGLYRYKLFPIVASIICFTLVYSEKWLGLPAPFFLLGGAFFLGNSFYIYKESVRKLSAFVAVVLILGAFGLISTTDYNAVVRPNLVFIDMFSFAAVLTFAIAGPKLPRLSIDISYSLYLIHCIIRTILMTYIPLGWTLFWVMLLMSLPICMACWYGIEKPALKLKKWRPYTKLAPAE